MRKAGRKAGRKVAFIWFDQRIQLSKGLRKRACPLGAMWFD